MNGVLISFLRIPPFVATLGSLGMAQGLALIASDGQSVTDIPKGLQAIYTTQIILIPLPVWIVALAYLAHHVLLYRTPFGTYIFALGGNREALAFSGVPWRFYLLLVYVLSGAMAGLGGLLLTARLASGHQLRNSASNSTLSLPSLLAEPLSIAVTVGSQGLYWVSLASGS